MSDEKRIDFCPHCNNRAQQTLLHTQEYQCVTWAVDDGDEAEYPARYFVAKCETCDEIIVYHRIIGMEPDGFQHAELLWPDVGLHDSVPENIASIYSEASRIKYIAPNAFAVQMRRAIEAICQDRGVNERNLAASLTKLGENGELPAALSEAADIIRLIGNIGAHVGEEDVHPLQVMALDDFFGAVVEYIYVSPAKISEFKNSTLKYRNLKP
jgi:hypothetical protein